MLNGHTNFNFKFVLIRIYSKTFLEFNCQHDCVVWRAIITNKGKLTGLELGSPSSYFNSNILCYWYNEKKTVWKTWRSRQFI